jgi:hypothetical protein
VLTTIMTMSPVYPARAFGEPVVNVEDGEEVKHRRLEQLDVEKLVREVGGGGFIVWMAGMGMETQDEVPGVVGSNSDGSSEPCRC